MSEKHSVLMVCFSNMCRSPIAEAVFKHLIKKAGIGSKWKVDSAAISANHIGEKANDRALLTLRNHKVPYNSKARQVNASDFEEFDYIFGMDSKNISDLERMAPENCKAKIGLLGAYDPQKELIISDPYFGMKNAINSVLDRAQHSSSNISNLNVIVGIRGGATLGTPRMIMDIVKFLIRRMN
ncbi:hypothetical protein HHI36_022477 [Cryptolaemus montrouzieri]|uniref:Low molecular weight phosphotyrosine protein phosphatase n=1 Tax=Cryptolaemus montrouzieri TaxID=559131 RepID=A0ABD2MZW2_9CUCU